MPLLNLPYLYEAEIRAPRRRASVKKVVREVAAFLVPEATAAEAPVCAVVEVRDPAEGGTADVGARRITYRSHGGRAYRHLDRGSERPTGVAELEARVARATMAGYAAWAEIGGYPRQAGIQVGPTHRAKTVNDVHTLHGLVRSVEAREGGTAKVVSDDAKARLAEAHVLFPGTLLVVDGEVWSTQDVGEPCYEVTSEHAGVGVRPRPDHVAVRVRPYVRGAMRGHVFRIDRRDAAVAFAGDLARRKACPLDVTETHASFSRRDLLGLDEALECAEQLLRARPVDTLTNWASASAAPLKAVMWGATVGAGRRDGAWADCLAKAFAELSADWDRVSPQRASDWTDWLARWQADLRDETSDVAAAVRGPQVDDDGVATFTP